MTKKQKASALVFVCGVASVIFGTVSAATASYDGNYIGMALGLGLLVAGGFAISKTVPVFDKEHNL